MTEETQTATPKYKIIITVTSQQGVCHADLKVGDRFEIVGAKMDKAMCPRALVTIYPDVHAMKYGANITWAKDTEKITSNCPDVENLVTFEIKREKIT